MIPATLINVFDEKELEVLFRLFNLNTQLLIGGVAEIDVDDWEKNTEYRNYTVHDVTVVTFWRVRAF